MIPHLFFEIRYVRHFVCEVAKARSQAEKLERQHLRILFELNLYDTGFLELFTKSGYARYHGVYLQSGFKRLPVTTTRNREH